MTAFKPATAILCCIPCPQNESFVWVIIKKYIFPMAMRVGIHFSSMTIQIWSTDENRSYFKDHHVTWPIVSFVALRRRRRRRRRKGRRKKSNFWWYGSPDSISWQCRKMKVENLALAACGRTALTVIKIGPKWEKCFCTREGLGFIMCYAMLCYAKLCYFGD